MTALGLPVSDRQPSSQQFVTQKVCMPIASQTHGLVLSPELPEVTCVLLSFLPCQQPANPRGGVDAAVLHGGMGIGDSS